MSPQSTDDLAGEKTTDSHIVPAESTTRHNSSAVRNVLSRFARSLVLSPLRLTDPSTDKLTGTTQAGTASKRKILSAFALSLAFSAIRLLEAFAFPESSQRSSATEDAIRIAIWLVCLIVPTVACGIALWRTKEAICWKTEAQRRLTRTLGLAGLGLPYATFMIILQYTDWFIIDFTDYD